MWKVWQGGEREGPSRLRQTTSPSLCASSFAAAVTGGLALVGTPQGVCVCVCVFVCVCLCVSHSVYYLVATCTLSRQVS